MPIIVYLFSSFFSSLIVKTYGYSCADIIRRQSFRKNSDPLPFIILGFYVLHVLWDLDVGLVFQLCQMWLGSSILLFFHYVFSFAHDSFKSMYNSYAYFLLLNWSSLFFFRVPSFSISPIRSLVPWYSTLHCILTLFPGFYTYSWWEYSHVKLELDTSKWREHAAFFLLVWVT